MAYGFNEDRSKVGVYSEDEIDSQLLEKAHVFETVADMKQGDNLSVGAICHTNGFNTSGDGNADWFEIVNTGTPDEETIIALDNGLYANKVYMYNDGSNIINVMKYGARFDDTDSLISAIDKISETYDSVFIPAGNWLIDKPINLPSNIRYVSGVPNLTVLYTPNTQTHMISLNCSNGFESGFFGIKFVGVDIDDAYSTITNDMFSDMTEIAIRPKPQSKIDYCEFVNVKCGIKIKDADNKYGLHISNCKFKNYANETAFNTVAFYIGNDSIVVNVYVWGFKVGAKCYDDQSMANSFFNNFYFWNHKQSQATYAIYQTQRFNYGAGIYVVNSYFDGPSFAFSNTSCNCVNCLFYYGDIDQSTDPTTTLYILNCEAIGFSQMYATFENCKFGINTALTGKIVKLQGTYKNYTVAKCEFYTFSPTTIAPYTTIPIQGFQTSKSNPDGYTYPLYKIAEIETYYVSGAIVKFRNYNEWKAAEFYITIPYTTKTPEIEQIVNNDFISRSIKFYFKRTNPIEGNTNRNKYEIYTTNPYAAFQFDSIDYVSAYSGCVSIEMCYDKTPIETNNYDGYTLMTKFEIAGSEVSQ